MSVQKRNVDIFIIVLLMFSELSFYTKETLNIYKGILVISVIYTGWKLLKSRSLAGKFIKSKTMIWLTGFYLFTFIDCFLRGYDTINYSRMISCWLVLSCIWVLIYCCKNDFSLYKYCYACELCAIIGCIYIFIKDGDSIMTLSRVGDSLSGNVNSVGIGLSVFSFGILFLFMVKRKKIHLIIYIITIIFMILTGSKKIIFSISLGIIMYIKFGGVKLKKTMLAIIAVGLCMFFIFNNDYLYGIFGYRIIDFLGGIGLNVGSAHYSFSTVSRENLIKEAWHLFLNKPIFGYGYGAVAHYSEIGFYSHNNMTELLACYGIIGFIFFYSCHVRQTFMIKKSKINKSVKTFLYIIILNALITDIGAVTYTATSALPYVFLILIDSHILKSNDFDKRYTKEGIGYEK